LIIKKNFSIVINNNFLFILYDSYCKFKLLLKIWKIRPEEFRLTLPLRPLSYTKPLKSNAYTLETFGIFGMRGFVLFCSLPSPRVGRGVQNNDNWDHDQLIFEAYPLNWWDQIVSSHSCPKLYSNQTLVLRVKYNHRPLPCPCRYFSVEK